MSYKINPDGTVTRISIPNPRLKNPRQSPKPNNNSSCLFGLLVSFLIIVIIGGGLVVGIMIFHGASERTEVISSQTFDMSGFVGQYPVTMNIQVSGSIVSGSYYYNRMGSNNKLMLNGTCNNGEIYLIETNIEGEQTGEFRGRLTNGMFNGSFINYNRGERMAFNLESL